LTSARSRTAPAAAANPWRPALYRMRGEPLPIYLFAHATLPGASLWAGARRCLRKLADDAPSAPIFVRACGPVFLQRAAAAMFSGRPLVVAGPAPLGVVPSRELHRARVWVPTAGVARAAGGLGLARVEVDDLAQARSLPPDELTLPGAGWHEPDVLRRVLSSLVTPTHVRCAPAPDAGVCG